MTGNKLVSPPSPSDTPQSAIEHIRAIAADERFSAEYLGYVVRSWLPLLAPAPFTSKERLSTAQVIKRLKGPERWDDLWNLRPLLIEDLERLTAETSVPQFEYCVFEGPPPAPHKSWSAWMDSAPRKGATIRASAHETTVPQTCTEKDAARYEWLRENWKGVVTHVSGDRVTRIDAFPLAAIDPQSLDHAIDAAMASEDASSALKASVLTNPDAAASPGASEPQPPLGSSAAASDLPDRILKEPQ